MRWAVELMSDGEHAELSFYPLNDTNSDPRIGFPNRGNPGYPFVAGRAIIVRCGLANRPAAEVDDR